MVGVDERGKGGVLGLQQDGVALLIEAFEGVLLPDANRGDLTVLYFGLAAVRQHCGPFYLVYLRMTSTPSIERLDTCHCSASLSYTARPSTE